MDVNQQTEDEDRIEVILLASASGLKYVLSSTYTFSGFIF